MAPKIAKEQSSDADTTRTEFITKLSTAAEAMRQFGNFADALSKVVAKAPLDDPEVVEALQAAIDAVPAPSRKRKLTVLGGADESVKRRKREKKPKDPNAPKAPPSAYILFQNEIRNAVRDANPDIQYRELMGLISRQWNALPLDKKQPYFDRVTAAKLTHEEELAKYNASHLNHVPSEGTSKTARKEVEPAAKPEKKVASKSTKPAPKSVEIVASSDNGQSEAASDDESVGEEKEVEDKASDDGSSEDESDEEPTPPPAKKAKKADKKK
ncbi:high mobility group box domain-containing protein [Butyriboletus roseoflavus]|nr:high mobility group box domain-containing protein [Butyriboletus roseoflavus]